MGVNTNYCTRKALGKQRDLPGRFRAGEKKPNGTIHFYNEVIIGIV